MLDDAVIKDMLQKVKAGTESRSDLIAVFTELAALAGVEDDPAPAPAPTPEPTPEDGDGEEKRSFFGG